MGEKKFFRIGVCGRRAITDRPYIAEGRMVAEKAADNPSVSPCGEPPPFTQGRPTPLSLRYAQPAPPKGSLLVTFPRRGATVFAP